MENDNIDNITDSIVKEDTSTSVDNNVTDNYLDFNDDELKPYKEIFANSKINKEDYDKFLSTIKEDYGEESYLNFDNNELEPYKEIFANSKINKEDSGEEAFNRKMEEIYGEKTSDVLYNFRELTDDVFTQKEKEILNTYPSEVKTSIVKLGKALGEKIEKIQRDYGLTTQETVAKPEINVSNARDKFKELTSRIINNDYRSVEEYNNLIKERLETAKYIK